MQTEDGARQYWEASLTWRGRIDSSATVQNLFETLRPLEIHRSAPLARQASELSDMIVRFKRQRRPKPRTKLHNLVELPVRHAQKTKAA